MLYLVVLFLAVFFPQGFVSNEISMLRIVKVNSLYIGIEEYLLSRVENDLAMLNILRFDLLIASFLLG